MSASQIILITKEASVKVLVMLKDAIELPWSIYYSVTFWHWWNPASCPTNLSALLSCSCMSLMYICVHTYIPLLSILPLISLLLPPRNRISLPGNKSQVYELPNIMTSNYSRWSINMIKRVHWSWGIAQGCRTGSCSLRGSGIDVDWLITKLANVPKLLQKKKVKQPGSSYLTQSIENKSDPRWLSRQSWRFVASTTDRWESSLPADRLEKILSSTVGGH
jgi:hypothetical protein